MKKLPVISGKNLTVPLHDPLKKGTLNRILKDAGISAEEIKGLLKKWKKVEEWV
jgi:hypothetical protein